MSQFVQKWFGSEIGSFKFNKHDLLEKKLYDHCFNIKDNISTKGGSNWLSSDTFNTFNVYDISKDKKFKELNDLIFDTVVNFSKELGYKKQIKLTSSWFNIYKKYNYQEFHHHNPNVFSCIYTLTNPDKNCKIVFKRPFIDNYEDDFKSETTSSLVAYNSVPGELIIFRSYLEHTVTQYKGTSPRITFAYNFI